MQLVPRPGVESLWAATAAPGVAYPRLDGDRQADVVVIGAGYTGLSAALRLAEGGDRPIVIDANRIGWGASGRNGGVVSAKFRASYRDIADAHGPQVARRMHEIAHQSVDLVEELLERHGIEAGFVKAGSLKCAHNAHTLAAAVADAEWMRREMGDASVSVLSREEVVAATGSTDFVGGVLSTQGGGLQPLSYVRGLARAAAASGVALHEETPALRLGREADGVVVETTCGTIRARQALIATNAYSDLTPATGDVRKRLIPFRSAMVATETLSANLLASIVPSRRICSETRRMMRWFRIVDDRLLFGGRGAFGKSDSASAFEALRRAMVRIFPALADTTVAYRWSGLVGMTLDALPHVGRLDDRVSYAMGYNGAGVAMSSLLGRYAAAFVRGESPDVALLDARRFRPVPFYALREPAVRLVAGWYQFLDRIGR